MTTISGHTTRANGTVLTAAIYNADHLNHIANAVALDTTKVEGGTPPVVDGQLIVWDGTTGTRIRTGGTSPYVAGGTDVAIVDGGTGQSTALLAFDALKQAATDIYAGVVEKATIAEVWAATADKFFATDLIETASAVQALVDAATIALNWDLGINFEVTLTANRILGNPTNGQPGTTRTVLVKAGATPRTLTFGTQYLGEVPTITDITDVKWYLLTIYCATASHFVVSSKRALG